MKTALFRRSKLVAISKNNRTLNSPRFSACRHGQETAAETYLFMRKNKGR